jgi:hypothetical protein
MEALMALLVEDQGESLQPIVDVTDKRGDGGVSPYLDVVWGTTGLVSPDDEEVRVYVERRGRGGLAAGEK